MRSKCYVERAEPARHTDAQQGHSDQGQPNSNPTSAIDRLYDWELVLKLTVCASVSPSLNGSSNHISFIRWLRELNELLFVKHLA